MSKEMDFTSGKILGPLMKFALPVLLALFLQAMYGAVDLIVVGQYSTESAMSAVATGSRIMMTLTHIFVGLGTGVTVLIGQKIGEGNPRAAGKSVGSGIALFAVVAAVSTAIFVAFADPIAHLMQVPTDAFDQAVSYVRICSAGTVFIVAFNLLGSIFRGIGDSKMPLITVGIACAVNIIGDLLLVAVFGMGAAGAAIATVFAQAVSVVLSVIIITHRKLPFTFSVKEDVRFDKELTGGILKLGIPIAMQDFLVGISFLVIMAIVNSLGLLKSAGVGVAEKLCAFVLLIPSSYSQSMSAFVAQNIGARRPDRARKALWCGVVTSLMAGVVLGYLSFFHGDTLCRVFTQDEAVIREAASYLKAYAIDSLLTSFLFCFIGYFSGRGNTVFVMLQGLIGAFCVRIPVSYFVSRIAGVELFYIGLATPASTMLQIMFCLVFYFATLRRDIYRGKGALQ